MGGSCIGNDLNVMGDLKEKSESRSGRDSINRGRTYGVSLSSYLFSP